MGSMTPAFAGALITDEAGRYLLQLRDERPGILHPGAWGMFGGHIEPGEAPAAAIARELQEEIGLVPSAPVPFRRLRIPLRLGDGPVQVRGLAVFAFSIDAARVATLHQTEGSARALWPPEMLLLEPRVAISARLAVALHAQPRLGLCTAPREDYPA